MTHLRFIYSHVSYNSWGKAPDRQNTHKAKRTIFLIALLYFNRFMYLWEASHKYIREFKEAVKGDRLSCHFSNANRLRIFLHAAYILMHSIVNMAWKEPFWRNQHCWKSGKRCFLLTQALEFSKKSIVLDYGKYNPMDRELRHLLHFYERSA